MTWSSSTQVSLFALMGYCIVGSFSHSSITCIQTTYHYSDNCCIIFTEFLVTEIPFRTIGLDQSVVSLWVSDALAYCPEFLPQSSNRSGGVLCQWLTLNLMPKGGEVIPLAFLRYVYETRKKTLIQEK